MMITFIIFCIIIYLVGIVGYISTKTLDRVEFHEGGFLNMGYTISSNRDMTTKDAWLSLIWPVLFIFFIIKLSIWAGNELFIFPCILVGLKYKDTELYKKIDRWDI